MRGCGIEMSDEVQSERDGDGDRDKRAFNSAHHAEVGHQLGSSVGLERERERERPHSITALSFPMIVPPMDGRKRLTAKCLL